MDTLPHELLIMMSEYLTLPDRCNLAQTCVHLRNVMFESISNLFKELVISRDKDILTKEFVQRYMSTKMKKLKIVIPELTDKCVQFLRDVFEVCNGIEGMRF